MITTINEWKKFNEYYNNNEVEEILNAFMETFNNYFAKNSDSVDIKNRALELIQELKDLNLREFLTWIEHGKTLKLQEILRNTTYKGNGGSPEHLLDFNAFAYLDTIGMYYREGYKSLD